MTLIGATTENPAFEVNGALLSRLRVYALAQLTPEEVEMVLARAAGEDPAAPPVDEEALALPGPAQRRRRAHGAERARAGARDGGRARRAAGRARPRRGRPAAARGPLRQTGRSPLRLRLRLDQGDARLGPGRLAVLPRGDAGGRRGPALHRAADGDPRLRGHRQRRPCRAVGGDRGRRRRRARRTAGGPLRARAGRDLPRARAEVRRGGPRAGGGPGARARARRAAGAALAAIGAEARDRTAGSYENPHRLPGHVGAQELLPAGVAGERFYEPDEAEAELAARLERLRRERGREER